jgi:hypothetical protein
VAGAAAQAMLDVPCQPPTRLPALPKLRFGEFHAWLLVLGMLDVGVTSAVLSAGGEELNALARLVIEHAGLPGMVALKAAGILTVAGICEYIGGIREIAARRILACAVALHTLAVSMGCLVLGIYTATLLAVF